MSCKRLTRAQLGALCLLLLVCFTGLAVSVFAIAVQAPVVVVAVCFLFGLAGVCVARRCGTREARLFVWVYCSAVLAAIALYMVYLGRYGAPYFGGGSDDIQYELDARDVVSSLGIFDYSSIRGGVVKQTHNSVGYVYLVSLLYRMGSIFGGFHTMLPRLLNCLALGLLAVTTYRLGQRCDLTERTSRWVAVFVGVSPIMVYATVHTFRDTIISLLTIWVVYIWSEKTDRFRLGRRFWLWGQTIVVAGVLSQLRLPQAVAVLAIAFVGDLLSSERTVRPFSTEDMYRLVMTTLLCAAILFLFQDEVASFIERLSQGQENYTYYRMGLSDGLSAYVFGAPVPLTYALRILYALVTPLPVLSQQLERLWLSLGTAFRYLFLPFLALGFIRAARERSKRQLVSAFLLLFSGAAFISFTSRHIAQFLPYAALVAGMGFERYRRYRFTVWLAALWLGSGLALAYFVLKST